MENMDLYNAVREVPPEAQKQIGAGRLKGMTDINPMWRIQRLTERFGPCGFGWKYMIREKYMEQGADGTVAAFVDIDLYYKADGEWSDPIPGTGGATFIAKEKNGLYTSDECYKMALTDALSVACKALGMGADVYWAAGRTKYSNGEQPNLEGGRQSQKVDPLGPACERCSNPIRAIRKNGDVVKTVADLVEYSKNKFHSALCWECVKELLANDGA